MVAAVPPEEKPPAPPLTPEQQEIEKIRKATSFLADKIINRDAPTPEEKKPDEPVPEAEAEPAKKPAAKPEKDKPKKEKAPETKEPEVKPKPEPKPKAAPSRHALSAEEIAEIAANAAVQVTKRKDQPAPEEDDSKIELAEEFADNRQFYEWLQRENPQKYGKLIRQLGDWGPKEAEYIEQWERANAGRKYDGDNEEHDEFYEKNQPKVEKRDLENAKKRVAEVQRSLERETMKREILDEIAPELNEVRRAKVQQQAAQKFDEALKETDTAILGAMNPEFVKLLGDNQKLGEALKKDKIALHVAQDMSNKYENLTNAVVAYYNGVPFDKNNQWHMKMWEETLKLEKEIREGPPEEQLLEGKQFSTHEDFQGMTPAQRARHWIVGESEILGFVASQAQLETSKIYKGLKYLATPDEPDAATNGKHEEPPPPAPTPQRASAPSVVPSPAVTPGSSGANNEPKRGIDLFHERLVGGR